MSKSVEELDLDLSASDQEDDDDVDEAFFSSLGELKPADEELEESFEK